MQNKMCKNVDRYLNEEKYDTGRIEKMLVDQFGRDEVTKATDELEQSFKKRAETLREYSNQLETRIAELTYQLDQSG